MKPLKIGIFHLGFFYAGGGERLVLEEAIGLQKKGHKVVIFSPVVYKNCFPELQEKVKIKPILPQLPKWIYDRETFLVFLSCLVFPFLAFRFRKFDVFLGANQPGPWFCWWLKKLFGKPYLIYLAQPTRILYPRKVDKEAGLRVNDGYPIFIFLFHLLKPLVFWADKVSIMGADQMLVNGPYAYKNLLKVYKRKGIVCAAGCYPVKLTKETFKKRFKGFVAVNGYKIRKPFVLLTNRHFPQKRFEYAIRIGLRFPKPFLSAKGPTPVPRRVRGAAASTCRSVRFRAGKVPRQGAGRQGLRFKLVITGKPTYYTRDMKVLVERLDLEDEVFFVGLVSEKDLAKLYRQAAVYVYTAPDEDFGMGVIEAMAAGVPVIAWQNGGPAKTVIHKKTGYLVPLGKVDDYAKAIGILLKDKVLNEKMGREGNRRARKHFSYKKHNEILEREILKIIPNI